jgi:hypothetical protein
MSTPQRPYRELYPDTNSNMSRKDHTKYPCTSDPFLQPENNNQKLILNNSTIKNHLIHLGWIYFFFSWTQRVSTEFAVAPILDTATLESLISILTGINKNDILYICRIFFLKGCM